jgi:hypothetical protein
MRKIRVFAHISLDGGRLRGDRLRRLRGDRLEASR